MPVCLGKIRTDTDALFSESIKHGLYDVCMFIFVERAVLGGNLVIGVGGIPQTEAVVVLGGQQKITEPAVLCHLGPFFRLEPYGVEGLVQTEILFLEGFFVFRPVDLVTGPFGVLVTQGPGCHHAKLAVKAPVHHESQLLVLEPFQLLLKNGLCGTAVGLGGAVVVDALTDDVLLFFFCVFVFHCAHFEILLCRIVGAACSGFGCG